MKQKLLVINNNFLGLVVSILVDKDNNPEAVVMNDKRKFVTYVTAKLASRDEDDKMLVRNLLKLGDRTQIIEDPNLKISDCVTSL